MEVLNRKVMVLNKVWFPVRIVSVKRALKLIFAERAFVLDHKNSFSPCDWDKWVKMPVDGDQYYITTTRDPVRVPEVIVLCHYDKMHDRTVRLTKRNIFLRDGSVCQYTGKRVKSSNADIDHIIPRSRGGKNSWDNMVVCSKEINRKKGDRTPSEAGLKLIKKPSKPSGMKLLLNPDMEILDSWKYFLKDNK